MSIVQPIVKPQTKHPVIYAPILKYFEDITYKSDFSAGTTFNYTGQNDLIYVKDVEVVELK